MNRTEELKIVVQTAVGLVEIRPLEVKREITEAEEKLKNILKGVKAYSHSASMCQRLGIYPA